MDDLETRLRDVIASKEDFTRQYELAIVEIVDTQLLNNKELECVLSAIIQDNVQNEPDLAYAAFYALCTLHRRYRNVKEYGELLKKWYKEFHRYPSYDFLNLMHEQKTHISLKKLIPKAYKLCENSEMKDNIGTAHLFAEIVADACEWEIDSFDAIYEEWFEEAELKIDEAIRESALESNNGEGYPKFYCTKGRLLFLKALQCDRRKDAERTAQEAIDCIEKAIDLERNNKKAIDYQIINAKRQAVFYQKMIEKSVELHTETLNHKINKMNIDNLQFLGFFAAIITLIGSDVMIISNNDLENSAKLMLIMTGCLLVAFGSFSLIVDNHFSIKNDWKRLGTILIGLFLIYGYTF